MKTQQELIEHVSTVTGIAKPDVRKVVDAAFGFVRESAVTDGGASHPSLGVIRARTRTGKDGESKTVYRFNPEGGAKGGKGKGRGKKGKAAAGDDDDAG